MRKILVLLFTAAALLAKSQPITHPVSARYLGVFALSARQSDVLVARNNPAVHAGLKQTAAGAYAERRFMLEDLNLVNLSAGFNTRSGNFGVHTGYFGFTEQNQMQASLSYGRKLGEVVDIGASFNFHQLSQAGIYGNASAITGTLGILVHLPGNMQAGISAFNPFRATWGKDATERLPSRYSFGMGMDVSEKLFTGIDLIKEENQKVDIQAGFHYSFLPQFFVRAGIATLSTNYFFALGFKLPAFRIDLSGSYHPQLGWSPGILLLANFGKAKEGNE